jgi:predicted esterase
MKKIAMILVLMLFFIQFVNAQQVGINEYRLNDDPQKRYLVVIPVNYDPDYTYHLLVFLHGSGDTGDNLARIFNVVNHPEFIVVCPHSGIPSWQQSWVIGGDYDTEDFVQEIVTDVKQKVKVHDRIFIGGHSAGAHLAYYLSLHEKDYFSSALILAGAILTQCTPYLANATGKGYYIMHGSSDNIVPVSYAYQAKDVLEDNGAIVELIIYQGVGHGGPGSAEEFRKAMTWLMANPPTQSFDPTTWAKIKAGL